MGEQHLDLAAAPAIIVHLDPGRFIVTRGDCAVKFRYCPAVQREVSKVIDKARKFSVAPMMECEKRQRKTLYL
jgi:hypothetical protein